jgi:exosortase C (VPDSG-CTERM-specific)
MIVTNQSAMDSRTNPKGLPTPGLQSRSASMRNVKLLAVLSLLLIACFSRPLYSLVRFAIHSDLYSHTLLIPFISAYLVWLQRKNLSHKQPRHRGLGLPPLIVGMGLLAAYWFGLSATRHFAQDYLALMTASFLCLLGGALLLLFGSTNLRAVSFPLAFLVFVIPLPTSFEHGIETFLQHGSASAACGLFRLFGMPVFNQGTEIQLPGFAMQVAPECSGIHSSLVLFITSLLAGHLLLRANWARAIFVLAVIPLAMLRNGFRIFVLGELCVQLDPAWIHSELHHRGGPLFFALSLIPFFLFLLLLRKLEARNRVTGVTGAPGSVLHLFSRVSWLGRKK